MPGQMKTVSMQSTLAIVKPDGVRRGLIGEIISRFEKKGLTLLGIDFLLPTVQQIRENYRDNEDETFFGELVSYMTSGYILPMMWQGPNAIESGRQIVGSKDPWESDSGSVRGEYAADPLRTVLHGSRDQMEAMREANIWFPSLFGVDEPSLDAGPGVIDLVLTQSQLNRLLIVKSFAPLITDPPPHGQRPNLEPCP